MWPIKKSYIIDMQMDMEWHTINSILEGQNIIKKNAAITFYNEREQLHLEDISCVCLEASFLKAGDGMWFPRNEAPDNAPL